MSGADTIKRPDRRTREMKSGYSHGASRMYPSDAIQQMEHEVINLKTHFPQTSYYILDESVLENVKK